MTDTDWLEKSDEMFFESSWPARARQAMLHLRILTMMRRSTSSRTKRASVRVEAPADLEEGYTFDVVVEGKPVKVTVPAGGVAEGESFEIPFSQTESTEETEEAGSWRTGLCACCDVFTQATFWMACCCPPVLIAQLVTRLGLAWHGRQDEEEETKLAFNKIVISFISVLIIGNLPVIGPLVVLLYIFAVMLYTGARVRKHMREHYRIPASSGLPNDDCLCLCACSCCSLIQMARQTHDDKEFPGYCCTSTGLEPGAPEIDEF